MIYRFRNYEYRQLNRHLEAAMPISKDSPDKVIVGGGAARNPEQQDGCCGLGAGSRPMATSIGRIMLAALRLTTEAGMKQRVHPDPSRKDAPNRMLQLAIGMLLASMAATSFAAWEGYERLTRDTLMTALSAPAGSSRRDLRAKNLSDLDLHGIDFKGADLSSSVFNGANLQGAKLDNTNLTVAFFEHADLSKSSFRNAVLFSAQLAGANARGADFDGARFIGDLKKADFTDAKMTHMKGAADMKNQSMGLMHTSMVNGIAVGADLSDSSFERAEFTFFCFFIHRRWTFMHPAIYRAREFLVQSSPFRSRARQRATRESAKHRMA
jgi:hypothetical protein